MDSVRGQVEDVRPRTSMRERRDTGSPTCASGGEDGTWVGGELRTIRVLLVPRKWVERKRGEAGAGRIPKGFGRFGRGLGRLMMLSSGFH